MHLFKKKKFLDKGIKRRGIVFKMQYVIVVAFNSDKIRTIFYILTSIYVYIFHSSRANKPFRFVFTYFYFINRLFFSTETSR